MEAYFGGSQPDLHLGINEAMKDRVDMKNYAAWESPHNNRSLTWAREAEGSERLVQQRMDHMC